jgi:hypothetical protein
MGGGESDYDAMIADLVGTATQGSGSGGFNDMLRSGAERKGAMAALGSIAGLRGHEMSAQAAYENARAAREDRALAAQAAAGQNAFTNALQTQHLGLSRAAEQRMSDVADDEAQRKNEALVRELAGKQAVALSALDQDKYTLDKGGNVIVRPDISWYTNTPDADELTQARIKYSAVRGAGDVYTPKKQ